jgi:uncharacterized membrane protein YkoI
MNHPLPFVAITLLWAALSSCAQATEAAGPAGVATGAGLRQAIDDALARHPGHFLAQAEIDDGHGGRVYEVEVANATGTKIEARYDVRTGELVGEREEFENDFQGIGQVLSVATVIDAVLSSQPGELREIELDDKRGRWVYEVRVKTDDRGSREVRIDAVTGEHLSRDRD